MAESRIRNTNRNILGSIVNNMVMLLLPFLVRTAIIYTFGAEYLGLNSLFSAILNMLALAELGFGSAMVFSMYKPYILYLIFLSRTVLSYFLYAYKSSVLTAAQHQYVMTNISTILSIVSELIKIAVVLIFKNFYLYCLIAVPFAIIYNLIVNYVVNRDYPQYKCKGTLDKAVLTDIKKRVAGLFTYKICYVFRDMFGSVVVSAFIGLAVLGQYNNYMYIYTSVAGFLNLLRTATTVTCA